MVRTFTKFNLPTEPEYFSLYKQINHEVWQSFERHEISAEELRPLRFQRFLTAIKEERDAVEMSTFFLYELSQSDFLIEGARTLVDHLKSKGHRLALITNGLKEVQRPRIAKSEMGKHFDAIVVSDEIGVAKPHGGFFEYAFNEMGNPAKEEVVVVGDSLSSDIQGGNNFGVSTCWFNPDQNNNLTGHTPKYVISSLKSLHEIV